MKLRAALTAAVVTAASFVTIGVGSATTASAADLVTLMWDDYECYSANMISGYTEAYDDNVISMDTTTGANGTSNSMRIDFAEGSGNFWRSFPEDNYILCNQYYEMAQTGEVTELYFTFWAKASEPTTMKAYLYVKTGLYQPADWTCNLSTEWQQYSYRVTDAVNLNEGSEGYNDTILNNIINAVWGTRADAYIHGLRFDKESDFTGTIWIDQIAFTGTTFSSGSGNLPTATLDESDMDVMHYCDTATHGATTVLMPAAASDTTTTTTTDDTTTTEESSAVEEETSSEEEVVSEEETSSEEEEEETSSTALSKTTTSAVADDGGGLSTGAIVGIIIAIVVVVAAGVVAFILYRKKAASAPTDGEGEEASDTPEE